MKTIFFANAIKFRQWLEKNQNKETELWVGYYKKNSGKANMTWSESVDQAICFGWIDGIRKSIDELSYQIRFTPRKAKSTWSAVNIKKVEELTKAALMHQSGLDAYARMEENNSKLYSFEQEAIALKEEYEAKLKANKIAWSFFQTLPPSTKKPSIWWVISAKQEATRQRRLDTLIQCSEERKKIPMLRRKGDGG